MFLFICHLYHVENKNLSQTPELVDLLKPDFHMIDNTQFVHSF